jgi:actin-related protein
MSSESERAIVIDNGTSFCKVGFAGEDSPVSSFPSVISSSHNQ